MGETIMLGLLTPTDPRWVEVALDDLDAVMLDHLHCELKAASNATALVARYPQYPRLVEGLTDLAREELVHVQQVFAEMRQRGITGRPPDEDLYAKALRRVLDDKRGEPLLDRLCVGAMIEARSCERFQLLMKHAPTQALRDWYTDLFASEARHHRLFSSLAEEIYGETAARDRLKLLAMREAEVLAKAPITARMH